MPEKLRIAFIGSGGIAGSHLSGLAKFDDVELAGFCDVVREAAEKRASEFGGKAFTRVPDMLDVVKPDACYVCLPPFAHGEAELGCVERGIPFFVEKPVGNDLNVIREIAAAVEKEKLLTGVGYMNRYRHSIQRAKEILAGDPPVITFGGWISRSPGRRPKGGIGSWWGVKEKSGGQLVEQTTHTVDIVRYLLGEATEVFAHATKAFNRIEGFTIEDASIVNIRFRSGALASLFSACACNVGGGVCLTIHAMNHTLRFTGWEHSARFESPNSETIEIKGEPNIFEIEDRCFVNAVREKDPSLVRSSYADGAKTTELTLAANTSMETCRPVSLGSV